MKISTKINVFRRNAMRFLTKNIGSSRKTSNKIIEDPTHIKRILICRPNARLGNLLLITPLIKEVSAAFPEAQIDLFVKGGLMPVILKNYNQIGEIIVLPKKPFSSLLVYLKVWLKIERKKYDLAINVDKDSSSGRLAVELSHAVFKFYGDDLNETKAKDYQHIAKYPVYNFREFLKSVSLNIVDGLIPETDLQLSDTELAHGKNILSKKFDNQKKTIAIFTYATGDKCFSEFWWNDFYALLKIKYERDYNILEILPVENVSQIRFKATSFYSKDIREIGSVLANTALFIGGDSGIMHLASAAKTATVGLFSVSKLQKYQPYGNSSQGIDTNTIVSKNQYILIMDGILMEKDQ
ncbi:glycosyltransferase family 9 protein [Flavobacterium sp. ANB]|uniref:glycosyltransferase family 9 protein n=1 Tax=unclassified Flavobacterium TaxID=196869 RepID=UPI0012B9164F|nr:MULTISPECIES: glycosyltransferase family 9 protein [unclassified Flavobacterium]MBF4516115.1 glycosyltransferase family 9 protein [Flavobacterium sp. ANB]MTD72212.1 lipopolysaccharide heptosyltransferase family protein [Flavobacterium sp. LC2016-13]